MPAKLFAQLRADVDGLKSRKSEMLAELDSLQKLSSLHETAKSRLRDARLAVLANPTDGKLLNAFRAAHASVAADLDLANAASLEVRNRQERIAVELAPSLVDLGERAIGIIDARLAAEGFSIRTGERRPNESRLIEHRSDETPCPNTSAGLMLLEFRDRINQALAWRNSSPQTLENVVGIIEGSPI